MFPCKTKIQKCKLAPNWHFYALCRSASSTYTCTKFGCFILYSFPHYRSIFVSVSNLWKEGVALVATSRKVAFAIHLLLAVKYCSVCFKVF